MTRLDKAARIARILEDLYPDPRIPLAHEDPFTLLVATVLSVQTTDRKVNEVTPVLFALAASPDAMATLDAGEIEAVISSLGLAPTKARNLRALSQEILVRHGGRVPASFVALESLPGVGHKTASVVMAQAFGVPAFPVDTHIHRLAGRWGLSRARSVEETELDLKKLFPRETWHDVHLQIIFFGRERCPARWHDFEACPICSWTTSQARRRRERKSWSTRTRDR